MNRCAWPRNLGSLSSSSPSSWPHGNSARTRGLRAKISWKIRDPRPIKSVLSNRQFLTIIRFCCSLRTISRGAYGSSSQVKGDVTMGGWSPPGPTTAVEQRPVQPPTVRNGPDFASQPSEVAISASVPLPHLLLLDGFESDIDVAQPMIITIDGMVERETVGDTDITISAWVVVFWAVDLLQLTTALGVCGLTTRSVTSISQQLKIPSLTNHYNVNCTE